MVNYRKIIELKDADYSNSAIAVNVGSSINTVAAVINLAQEHNLKRPLPEEFSKPGVNLNLLWSEYCIKCEQEHSIPYQRTQFCDKYRKYALTTKATLRIKHKPAEVLEVDWVGNTIPVMDNTMPYFLKGFNNLFQFDILI